MVIATVLASPEKMLLQFCLLLLTSCSVKGSDQAISLSGSTLGDQPVKSILFIDARTTVDFIRWNLVLDSKGTFELEVNFGESQPNTLGFKGGGQRKKIRGTCSIMENGEASRFRQVYLLKSDDLKGPISLAKLNENVFHLLTSDHHLMNGNGGWSYSLHRITPVEPGMILISSPEKQNDALQLVFEGRTPCRDLVAEHPEMKASPSCFKLKWKLVLNRDAATHLPSTCSIRNIVDNQPRDISGKWDIIKGTKENPDLMIYRIMAGNLADPILLLIGDDDVLFFLHKSGQLITGNADFGFALNRRF